MFVVANVITAVAIVLHYILETYSFIVLASVILSWIRPNPSQPFVRTLLDIITKLTEPVFHHIRKRLPRSFFSMGIDLSPILVFVAIMLLDRIIVQSLIDFAIHLRLSSLKSGISLSM